jgi:hypothetical protein
MTIMMVGLLFVVVVVAHDDEPVRADYSLFDDSSVAVPAISHRQSKLTMFLPLLLIGDRC